MGRKPKENESISKSKESVDEKLQKNEELLAQKAEINRLDSDKSNKDMLLKTIDELKKCEKDIRTEIANLGQEAQSKSKIIQHLENEIKSMNYTLSKSGGDFEKENAERIKVLAKKESDNAKAEGEYQAILLEYREKTKTLKAELQKIADERVLYKTEIASSKEWVETNKKSLSSLEKDLENREEELKAEREEFEKEREEMKPTLARLSEIKNENTTLLQKLEREKDAFETQKAGVESYKATLEAEVETLKAKLEKERQGIKVQEGKLRQWEQDLNDQALETKAHEAEAQRMMKRYQLTAASEK